jgi:hypothetical protein
MHSARSLRERRGQRSFPTETQRQFARPEMAPRLRAERLARVNRIANAGAAEIASQALIEPSHVPLAMWTMNPRSLAAEMNLGPGDAYPLRRADAPEVQQDRKSGCSYLRDAGPSQQGAKCDPVTAKKAPAPKFAHVKTIDRKFLDSSPLR